jgi:hypothetical protein
MIVVLLKEFYGAVGEVALAQLRPYSKYSGYDVAAVAVAWSSSREIHH